MALRGRYLRHKRLRKKVIGSKDKPRLCVSRSLSNMSVQLIDDIAGKTLMSCNTVSASIKAKAPYGGNVKAANLLGEEFAREAIKKGFATVVFDRSGHKYHGRVKAVAEACRKGGLKF